MDGCLVGCGGSFQPAWESSGRAICEFIIHCAGINRYMLGERFGKTSPLVVSRYSRYSFWVVRTEYLLLMQISTNGCNMK